MQLLSRVMIFEVWYYVLLSSLVLILLFWQWRPMRDMVWTVNSPIGASLLIALFWLGWGIVLISTFLINHFDLFGLQQVYANWQGTHAEPPSFRKPLFYKFDHYAPPASVLAQRHGRREARRRHRSARGGAPRRARRP
jgi:protein-S-isoprenylcysteine O-methyltransferase Ste14